MLRLTAALAILAVVVAGELTAPLSKPLASKTWRDLGEQGEVDPYNELITVQLRIGPFGPIAPHPPTADTQSGPTGDWAPELIRPFPDKAIEVAFWGEWILTDASGAEIPRRDLYLHHILAYDQNSEFITGCSSERTTWGVDHIPFPYRQLLTPGQIVKANGFHYNNMANRPQTFYVNYTMKYKIHDPSVRQIRVVRSFYWMDNFNVPGNGGVGSIHTRPKTVRTPKDLVIVSMNGHLHQGGQKLQLTLPSGEILCESYNLYHVTEPCYWDCPDICPYKPHGWKAQWGTTTCYMERPINKDINILSAAFYDNSCAWRGVMAWWFNWGWSGETSGVEEVLHV